MNRWIVGRAQVSMHELYQLHMNDRILIWRFVRIKGYGYIHVEGYGVGLGRGLELGIFWFTRRTVFT